MRYGFSVIEMVVTNYSIVRIRNINDSSTSHCSTTNEPITPNLKYSATDTSWRVWTHQGF